MWDSATMLGISLQKPAEDLIRLRAQPEPCQLSIESHKIHDPLLARIRSMFSPRSMARDFSWKTSTSLLRTAPSYSPPEVSYLVEEIVGRCAASFAADLVGHDLRGGVHVLLESGERTRLWLTVGLSENRVFQEYCQGRAHDACADQNHIGLVCEGNGCHTISSFVSH
jgi:hypothetical protein